MGGHERKAPPIVDLERRFHVVRRRRLWIQGPSGRLTRMVPEHFDVIIVGAGLSGIGAAVHLHEQCPGKSYVILEGRPSMGGTWDLFRYPGIRSDSDMHTLGYRFKPWRDGQGDRRRRRRSCDYVKETAAEYGVDGTSATATARRRPPGRARTPTWTVEALRNGHRRDRPLHLQLPLHVRRLLQLPAGLHAGVRGPASASAGTIVHPQKWPEDLDYAGKKVVVIGSGATAMTLVPAMAKDAAHIVMLQRSPTYVVSRPDKDVIANALRKVLPERWAYAITRWKNVGLQQFLYRRTRTHPEQVKAEAPRHGAQGARARTTTSRPTSRRATTRGTSASAWCRTATCSQRSAPARRRSSPTRSSASPRPASRSTSGKQLDADIIVTATGLNLVVLGEMQFAVDGEPVDFAQTWTYKGMMYSGRAEPGLRPSATSTPRGRCAPTSPPSTSAGCSTTWTRRGARQVDAAPARERPRHAGAAVDRRLLVRLHAAHDAPLPEAGRPRAVDQPAELRARQEDDPHRRRSRTARWSSATGSRGGASREDRQRFRFAQQVGPADRRRDQRVREALEAGFAELLAKAPRPPQGASGTSPQRPRRRRLPPAPRAGPRR